MSAILASYTLVLPADRGKIDRALQHYRDQIQSVTVSRREGTISDLDATTIEANALAEYAEVLTAKADWKAGKVRAADLLENWHYRDLEVFVESNADEDVLEALESLDAKEDPFGYEQGFREAATKVVESLIEDIRHSLNLTSDAVDVTVGLNWVMFQTGGLTYGDAPTDEAEAWERLDNGAPDGFGDTVLAAIGFVSDWHNRLALLA